MTAIHSGVGPDPSSDLPDLSREQVLALFRDRDNDALKRHTALVGTDGAGTLYVSCGCEIQYSLEEWMVHLYAVLRTLRRPRPQQKR